MLLRFPGILDDRLATIAGAFDAAIAEMDYPGTYRGVYPIKVNQQRHIVEELLEAGHKHGFGLEAGSKPELLAVLALLDEREQKEGLEPLIVCNGFKDARYIEGVVLANKLGRTVVPVVEKADELPLIVRMAAEHGVAPPIGIRVKLASAGAGRWAGSGGERAKFGLFVSEVVEAVELLRAHGMLDCLQLVHFHLGSQLTDMRAFKAAVVEAARVYTGLAGMGAGLRFPRRRRRHGRRLRRHRRRRGGRPGGVGSVRWGQLHPAGVREQRRLARRRGLPRGGCGGADADHRSRSRDGRALHRAGDGRHRRLRR